MGVRAQYIDIARGISIICIVLGHLGNGPINRVVFTFHVPVFFLITGYYLNKKQDFRTFCRDKARRLLVPYYVTCFGIIVLAAAKRLRHGDWQGAITAAKTWLYATVYAIGGDTYDPFYVKGIGAIWFLWAMFLASVALRWLLDRKTGTRVFSVLLLFLLARWSLRIMWLPLSLQGAGTALFYLYTGYLLRQEQETIAAVSRETMAALTVFAFCVWLMFIRQFTSFWLVTADIGRGVVDVFSSLCACWCVILISNHVEQRWKLATRFLAFLGENSIFMLCIHIVELNLFPWNKPFEYLVAHGFPENLWLHMVITGKFLMIIPLTYLCAKCNFTRKLFGMREVA